ncbi:MAG: branched-chain amino acid transport system II carrier protein, partial [Eggerthellaceae bacterium]
PPFITVVVLLIFRKQIKLREVYQGAAIGALVGGIVVELAVTKVATIVPLELLPLSSMGFGWIVFALMGTLVGMVVGLTRRKA